MNKVEFTVGQLSDGQIRAGVRELMTLETTGILPDGEVRKLAMRLSEEAGLAPHDSREVARHSIVRLAAKKWADSDVSRLEEEHLEDQTVIAVWRGRALRAEARSDESLSMLGELVAACEQEGVRGMDSLLKKARPLLEEAAAQLK